MQAVQYGGGGQLCVKMVTCPVTICKVFFFLSFLPSWESNTSFSLSLGRLALILGIVNMALHESRRGTRLERW